LREVVAKVRTGGPIDDADDMGLPVWAGVVPLRLVAGAPEPAADLAGDPVTTALAWPPEPGRTHPEG
ncbi:MAG TPA: pyridoxamine 5'-phosphate oxidase family protein, partial [Candidatus Binatia bacterium]|nr:pyridoxamine 5'-phosphate oxidase family protein [Candidatus Binatia bacterium]